MIFYEDEPIDGKWVTARGKCCWFEANDIKQITPQFLFLFTRKLESKDELLPLKVELVSKLKKKGFVFFSEDKTVYRYKLSNSGKLKEISVNYHHIS